MRLRWFGQSCFLLTSQAGTRVLMDPFDGRLGYKVPKLKVDLVTSSHDHFDLPYEGTWFDRTAICPGRQIRVDDGKKRRGK